MLKGKKLKPGSMVGVVAPANFASQKKIRAGQKQLEQIGYRVKLGRSCFEKWFNCSGNDELRAGDINEMFADSSVDGIICLRGGYGSIRLLEKIDFVTAKNNPKLFIGFSDITSLHIALNKHSSLATIHGPMLTPNIANNFDDLTKSSFINLITGKTKELINTSDKDNGILVYGKTEGQIIGGNLSVLCSTLGTKHEIDTRNRILFLEEIKEYTYKIDRMLTQLKLAGKFHDCCGIVLGNFKNCNKDKTKDFSLEEVFNNVFADFNKPVIYNFKSGHCVPMTSIPFGVKCHLSALKRKVSLKILELPVI